MFGFIRADRDTKVPCPFNSKDTGLRPGRLLLDRGLLDWRLLDRRLLDRRLLSGLHAETCAAASTLVPVLATFMSDFRAWFVRNGCALSTLFVLERDCVTVTQERRGICTQTSPYPLQFPCWPLEHPLLVPTSAGT